MSADRLVLPAVSLEAAPNPLQAEYIQVKDGKTGKGPGADSTAVPKVDVGDKLFNQILAIKPEEIGQGFKDAQAAARAFMAVPDKAEALTKGAPAFEAAVTRSDSDYVGAIAKYSPEYNLKRQDVRENQTKLMMSAQVMNGIVEGLPAGQKEKVGALIGLADDPTISAALKANLRKEMEKTPGLLKAFDGLSTALKAQEASVQAMKEAAQPLMQAAYEQAATRYIYAHAMELAGDKGRAVLMKQEGQSKVSDAATEFLNAPKPPSRILQV